MNNFSRHPLMIFACAAISVLFLFLSVMANEIGKDKYLYLAWFFAVTFMYLEARMIARLKMGFINNFQVVLGLSGLFPVLWYLLLTIPSADLLRLMGAHFIIVLYVASMPKRKCHE